MSRWAAPRRVVLRALSVTSSVALGGIHVIASSLVAIALPTIAEPDGGPPLNEGPVDLLMKKQAPLLDEVNSLVADWQVESPFALSEGPIGPLGYGGVELDVDAETVLVFWKYGTAVPSDAEERVQAILRRGIRVEVLKAPFSFVDLRDEIRAGLAEFIAADLPVRRFGPSRGAQGLEIATEEPDRVRHRSSASRTADQHRHLLHSRNDQGAPPRRTERGG